MNEINQTVEFLKNNGFENAQFGIVLGTGLGKLVNEIEIVTELDYAEIPNFPLATVESHQGKLIFGTLQGKTVIAMQGRFHYYEGYSAQEITFPIRVMKYLGVETLIVSNAAGAINLNFKKGEVMLITDHINLLPENPLRGKNNEAWGPRFPDMSKPYHPKLIELARNYANSNQINLHEGVYVSVPGPNLETPAEYRYLKVIGADAVGMSTVPEVIVANHMNMNVCAFSVLTDECDPDNLQEINITDILENAAHAEPILIELTKAILNN